MKSSHRVIVESRKVKYDFVIRRNITILTGDSGTGKTVLIDLIRDYRRYGSDSGVFLSCDCECRTIDNEDWERQIEETSGSIIFIDEGNRFLTSKKFAMLVQNSDNYFVIATRENYQCFHTVYRKFMDFVSLENSMKRNRNIMKFTICTEKYLCGVKLFPGL